MSVQIIGYDKIKKHFNLLANPQKTFDDALRKTVINSRTRLVKGTTASKSSALRTGDTSRAWTNPLLKPDGYHVENKKRSGKWNIAKLINKGHGIITPKASNKRGLLYIPLTRAGQDKRKGTKFGEDFILTKKVKAMTGSGFLGKEERRASIELTKRVINDIRKVFTK